MAESEPRPPEQSDAQAGVPNQTWGPELELVCPKCRLRLERFAEVCPECGTELGSHYTLTYRPPTSALAWWIAVVALIAIGLMLAAVVAVLLFGSPEGATTSGPPTSPP
jgi:hypothetical protein